jgi:PAS domain S-box-containing protein
MDADRHTEVLLITSDQLQSQQVQDLLAQVEYESFHVVCETGLTQGLERLAEGETDVVLVSLTLPDSQSLSETLARLRGVNQRVPVVVLTSVRDGVKGKAIIDGAQDYIVQERMSAGSLAYALTHAVERNVAGVRLAFANRQFRALIENAHDGIAVVSAEGAICYQSPSFARALGYDEGEGVGFSSLEFVHPEDQARARELLGKVVSNRGVVLSHEMRVRHKDGSWHYVELRASNHLDDPAIEGVVINLRDISERKKGEEALQGAEADSSQLSRAGAAGGGHGG